MAYTTTTGTTGPDTLNGTAVDDLLQGLEGNDTLNGGDGNDRLEGGAGADQMTGGAGNDLYVVDDAGDTIVESASNFMSITRGATMPMYGMQPYWASDLPTLSADGSVLTFRERGTPPTGSYYDPTNNSYVRWLNQSSATWAAVTASGPGYGIADVMVSGNGQSLVFTSWSDNVVTGDTNTSGDVFVRNLQTDTYTRVSVANDGSQANSYSYRGQLSSDGRIALFVSNASNLVANDTNNQTDLFVRNLNTGTTERVNISTSGAVANSWTWGEALSSNGSKVVFQTDATNLSASDTNTTTDIFVRDRAAGTTALVSTAADGSQANAAAYMTGFAGNGRYVVFQSAATNLVANDTNNQSDLFRKDLQTGEVRLVNTASDGTQANNYTFSDGGVSEDGRFVVFMSTATNLVANDTNGFGDVFVKDMQTGQIARVSVASDGAQGNGMAWSSPYQTGPNANQMALGSTGRPTISGDGTTIAFVSQATNLIANDTNGKSDVFVVSNPLLVANGGVDTVESSISYTLPAGVENLILTGSADINGTGNAQNNQITGNSGNNTLDGGAGVDTLAGGAGNDRYVIDTFTDSIVEQDNAGIDTVELLMPANPNPTYIDGVAVPLTYTLASNVENLVMTGSQPGDVQGNSLANTITGNSGNNSLYGYGGNDILDGGGEATPGGDTLLGGDGDDIFMLRTGAEYILEYDYGGYDTAVSEVGFNFANYFRVENFQLGGTANLNLDGSNNGETLTGNSGNNTINGLNGSDMLDGGAGDDVLNGGAGNDVLNGNMGNDTLDAGEGSDWYYVYAGEGQDTINQTGAISDTDALKLWGINQSAVTFSRSGNDLMLSIATLAANPAPAGAAAIGGSTQTIRIVGQYAVGSVDKQIDIIEFDNGTQLQRSAFEFLGDPFTGTPGPDTMAGTAGADTLTGLGGNDTYTYNHIDDLAVEVDGGGFDTVNSSVTATLPAFVEVLNLTGSADLAGSGNGLANQINGNSGANWISGEDGNDTIHGNGGNDDIRGGAGGDLLYGDDGDDVLDGGVGADLMNGGAGNDRYTVSEAGDVIEEAADGGIDTVVANGDYVLYANLENLELLAGAVNGSGNEGSNWIIGNAASNWIGGGAGGDTIFGRDGNDAVNGDDGDDVLYGEAGDDVLDGGTGINQLIGGTGNDRYIIRNLGDTITEDAGGGTDTAEVYVDNYVPFANVENVILADGILSASGSSADNWMEGNAGDNFLGGGLGHDALFGFAGNDYLKGDDGDDRLEGGEGDDTLEGNAGVDTMVGGDGNDTYYVDGPGDIIVETTTGGVDTVYSSGFYTLSGNIENLVIIGTQAVDGTGDGGDNWMRGNDQANVLNGAGGNDAIYGGNGNDTLRGGAGDDILAGEAGDDGYIYALGDGADEVTDGAGNDTLTFSAIARSLLSFTRSGDDLLITVDDAGQPGEVAVIGWFVDPANQIEQIVDADGARSAALISALADPAPAAPVALSIAALGSDTLLLAA